MITAKDNPFATQRVLRIRYRPQTCTWDELGARLESMHYRAAIVGTDGTGKTTLIEDLHHRLTRQGLNCRNIFVTMDITVPHRKIDKLLRDDTCEVLLIDGADHLDYFTWRRIKKTTTRTNTGLVITSHKPHMLPTLIECTTTPQLLFDITNTLDPETATSPLTEALYHKHRGNIRDALRELYDRTAAGKQGA